MAKVVLFGVGQLAEVALFYLTHDSPNEVVAFTVDGAFIPKEKEFHSLPVVPFEEVERLYPPDRFKMFLPISYRRMNKLRVEKYKQAKEKGYGFISYISSKATTWPGLRVGENCFIFENNVIQPYVEIGNNIVMWSGNHIGHHTKIKDHCFLASHVVVSGGVEIDERCFLGVNATLGDNIKIARECLIGAGALVTKDTEAKGVYRGKPAELYRKKSDELRNF